MSTGKRSRLLPEEQSTIALGGGLHQLHSRYVSSACLSWTGHDWVQIVCHISVVCHIFGLRFCLKGKEYNGQGVKRGSKSVSRGARVWKVKETLENPAGTREQSVAAAGKCGICKGAKPGHRTVERARKKETRVSARREREGMAGKNSQYSGSGRLAGMPFASWAAASKEMYFCSRFSSSCRMDAMFPQR